MKRAFGMGVGVIYLMIAGGTLMFANRNGWAAGHSDVGFWFTIVASLLTIAATGALVGTWIHTRDTKA